jgi:phosphate/sulfate permease
MDGIIVLAEMAVLACLAFCFTNGFQDAASMSATLIASRSATPAFKA